MPEFLDIMTGRTIEADGHRAAYYRRSTERFQEIGADEPPDGTVAEVLAWAGDDPNRRAAALKAEQDGKQRKGVLEALS